MFRGYNVKTIPPHLNLNQATVVVNLIESKNFRCLIHNT